MNFHSYLSWKSRLRDGQRAAGESPLIFFADIFFFPALRGKILSDVFSLNIAVDLQPRSLSPSS